MALDKRVLERISAPHPKHPAWGQVKLPNWVNGFRDHQWAAAQEIASYFEQKIPLVFLDGPTGAGKTLIGDMVRRLLGERAVYVCSGKGLQDQFLGDFPYAKVLKGRANYPTLFGDDGVTCADCMVTPGDSVCVTGCYEQIGRCPYLVAKGQAGRAEVAVLNTAYFLGEAQGKRTQFGQGKWGLGIFDEADTLESELMGHVEVNITARRMKELGIDGPKHVTKEESWGQWVVETLIPAVEERVKRYPRVPATVSQIRAKQSWERLLGRLRVLASGIGTGNWVFDGYREGGAVFRPVRVHIFGPSYLWRHFPKVLCMSATLISADEMVQSLGYQGEYRVVRAPMTFPVSHRKIITAPVANMTSKAKETEWPKAALAISNILAMHPGERVLVHTVSYALAAYLMAEVKSPRKFLTYRNATERESVLTRYRRTPGAVLFAPSMERGVDLKHDDCRVVIVAKMPYLSLGDKQVSARLHSPGGQLWYQVQTVRSLVQSTGRGVRSADDYCVSYIVDRQFLDNIWKKSKGLLPDWWKEAVDMSFPVAQLKKERT